MRELKGASIDATNVVDLHQTKDLPLTTSDQSLLQTEGLLPGESISSDYWQMDRDGKYYVKSAMMSKHTEKTMQEKSLEQQSEQVLEMTVQNNQVVYQKGVKYDAGKPAMELLSTKALIEIAKVMGKGKEKYGANNWKSGLAWSRVIGAAYRHLSSFNDGEDLDPETGLSHIAHLACCCMFLLEYIHTHPNLDDRYKGDKK